MPGGPQRKRETVKRRPKDTTSLDASIGIRIRARRLHLGLSQDDLAVVLGVKSQQIHKYESSQNRISAARLSEIAALLGVPLSFFFCSDRPAAQEPAELEDEGGIEPDDPGASLLVRHFNLIKGKERREFIVRLVMSLSRSSRKAKKTETGGA